MNDLIRNLREEALRLSGLSLDRGVQEAGISANLADRAADVIEEYAAKEILADRAHKVMTEEIEKLQRNLRHWREECGKLHAQLTIAKDQRNEYQKLSQEANRALAGVRKCRDGYADQARFADVDPASYFREFVRRLDAACSQATEGKWP